MGPVFSFGPCISNVLVFVTSHFWLWFIGVVILVVVFEARILFCPKFCASCGTTLTESVADLCRTRGIVLQTINSAILE